MRALLKPLAACQFFNALDLHFANTLAELVPATADSVVLAAALTSRQTRAGHVCVRLEDFAGTSFVDAEGRVVAGRFPELEPWLLELQASALVGEAQAFRPLILVAQRLYLERYWEHETRLAELLRARIARSAATTSVATAKGAEPDATNVNAAAPARPRPFADEALAKDVLKDGLARLFQSPATPQSPASASSGAELGDAIDWQRVAVQVALTQRLCIISGGPGTGKTSTVVRLLALLAEQARALGRGTPRVALMAPTGKAAARLVESIKRAKSQLRTDPEIRDSITEEASTIHRALGAVPGAAHRFAHDAARPLLADIVIVDEASMVDVALMRRLVQAVSPEARLILLGDADQLASVEAGAVLGDICAGASNRYLPALAARLYDLSGERVPIAPNSDATAGHLAVQDCVVRLEHSYRFRSDGGIGALARAIRSGDERAVVAELQSPNNPEVGFVPRLEEALGTGLTRWVTESYASYLESTDPQAALECFGRVRVLCAHRRGHSGVEHLNALIENALADALLITPSQHWYAGRPVLVTKNDYQLQLFNGDVGVVLRQPVPRPVSASAAAAPTVYAPEESALRAVFAGSDGALRAISPARLPSHETAFAMSIHKSQGSEFNEVAVVLPEPSSPLLSRELLYTAVTRARRRVVVFGSMESVIACVRQPVRRASGLAQALLG